MAIIVAWGSNVLSHMPWSFNVACAAVQVIPLTPRMECEDAGKSRGAAYVVTRNQQHMGAWPNIQYGLFRCIAGATGTTLK